jgi:pyruvate formate lyase activating enzyme
VLVPGLTDDLEDIAKTAAFAAELSNVERVDVLPFHQMGRYKWHNLKMNYTLEETQPPSAELVERTLGIFRGEGLKAV